MGRSRDIAAFLGKTELSNANNNALLNTASSIDAGLDSAAVINLVGTGLTVYATPNLLPTSGLTAGDQAFVTSNSRIYISNGSGWYNVALINSTPTFTTGPDATYALSNDLTPTVITLVAQDSDGQVITYSATDSGMDGIATLSQDSSVFTITPLTDSAGGDIGTFTITFQATDGIGIASALSTFTLSFGPDWSATPAETIIRASDTQAADRFGNSVSISSDGTYAIVSAHFEDGGAGDPLTSAGAVYVYVRSGSTWTQQAKLTASDAQTQDEFGYSISISGDGSYVIVGARAEDGGVGDPLSNAGAAYIFVRSGSTWTQQAKLVAPSPASNTNFGRAVDINSDGTYVMIGTPYEQTVAPATGAVYVFTRSGSTWTQQAKIEASDAQTNDWFGSSVAINPDATYAVIGATLLGGGRGGAAYIFTRSGSTWTEQQKIQSSDIQADDFFGRLGTSINSDGTYVTVTAFDEDGGVGDPLTNAGAAYVFTRSGSTWTEQAKIVSSDLSGGDDFGFSSSMNADATYLIVGSRYHVGVSGDPLFRSGAAYIFSRSGSTWTEVKKLTSSDLQGSDQFGTGVSMSSDGNYIIVGAPFEDGGAGNPTGDAGAAYIYEAG